MIKENVLLVQGKGLPNVSKPSKNLPTEQTIYSAFDKSSLNPLPTTTDAPQNLSLDQLQKSSPTTDKPTIPKFHHNPNPNPNPADPAHPQADSELDIPPPPLKPPHLSISLNPKKPPKPPNKFRNSSADPILTSPQNPVNPANPINPEYLNDCLLVNNLYQTHHQFTPIDPNNRTEETVCIGGLNESILSVPLIFCEKKLIGTED